MLTAISRIESLGSIHGPLHLAAGVFDGLHLGHQAVIGAAVAGARKSGGSSVVLTFDPHPAALLRPEAAPTMLVSADRRAQLVEEAGVDALLVLPFTIEMAKCRARPFIESLAEHCQPLAQVSVGWDWTFGYKREGDIALLTSLSNELDFEATICEPVRDEEGDVISSTAIRKAIAEGEIQRATHLLGWAPGVGGTVVRGQQLGSKIGFPTANLPVDPIVTALPPNGVYAVRAHYHDQSINGVANLGVRPTVETNGQRQLEVHLFDFDADLYDKKIRIEFVSRIRAEKKFDGLDSLKAQIAEDMQQAKGVLS